MWEKVISNLQRLTFKVDTYGLMMKLPKILYVTDIVGLGGGETSFLNHLKKLDHRKFVPAVLCSKSGMLTDEIKKMGMNIHIIDWNQIRRLSKFLIYYPIISSIKMFCCLIKHPVDIINVNTFNAMALIAPAAKMCGIPLLWTCHGWWPTGRLTGMFINTFVDKVIAVSDFVRNKLETEGYVHPSIIERIPLGIDLAKFRDQTPSDIIRREFGLNKNTPLIGMIARFQEIKGHHVFVRMAAEICKTHPDARFMIVGSSVFGKASETDYYREIQELIYKHSLDEKIILTGFRDDIAQILGALEVLVVPSEFESFGMVILEAMAMGIPVVSCAKGGPEEIIEDGENGFLIPEQNPIRMAQKVLYLIENPHIKKAMGVTGKKTVSRNYRIEDQVKKIESIYGACEV